MPPAAPSDAPLSYGAVQDPANSSTPTPTSLVRPGLPARTLSLRSARSLSAASGLTPSTTLRQSGSLRALFRLTSTGSNADAITPTSQPKQTPASLQHARSLRTHRRVAKEAVPLLRRSLTTSQLPPLLRAMSSVLRLPRDEEIRFQCHICFDDAVPISDAVTLAACGHRYCTACFQSYVELKIRDGHVYPVCFHPLNDAGQPDRKTCGVAVATDQIERIVTPEVWKKFKLFRFNKEHEHARECPHCAFVQECRGPAHPACLCDHCHGAFCFFHDLAHDGRSCADYELENAETESINRAAINQIAKSCPGCHRDVEKDGGCNHMKCVVCQTSFCWLCSEVIEDVPMPSHFSESNENSCSGRQFDGSEPMELPWQVRAYAIGITILCYPFAFLSAVLATPVTWCRSTLSSKVEAVEEKNTVSEMFWFNHTVAMIWLALGFSLIFFIVAIVLELTFRLLVFVVVLPLLIVKAIVVKSINCCRRQRQSTPTLTPPNIYGEVDLEAGHVNGVVSPPPAKPEGENAVARPPAAMA